MNSQEKNCEEEHPVVPVVRRSPRKLMLPRILTPSATTGVTGAGNPYQVKSYGFSFTSFSMTKLSPISTLLTPNQPFYIENF